MELRPEQLEARLAKAPLAPVYLIAGPETLRVLEAGDAIRAKARQEGISEREVLNTDERDFNWGQLENSFHAPSLFSSRCLVELRMPNGKPGKEGSAVITDFCANPADDVVLLITANEWSRKHQGKWSEAIDKIGVISIAWAIKPNELEKWIERRLYSRSVQAQHEAVKVLAERSEGNLLAAAQEIDKLALLAQGQTLDAAMMMSLVADAARYNVFGLAESALAGQAEHAVRMLHGLRAEGEALAGLLPMLIRELLRMVSLAQVQAQGGNLASAMRAQGIWESQQAACQRALQRHKDINSWERFVIEIGHIDKIAKGRASGDGWVALERLLLAIAQPNALALLAA